MKKLLFALFPCAALLLAACEEAKYEIHQTFFYPQMSQGMKVYADQQSDTIRLLSLDSWTLASSTPEWLTVTPNECTINAGSSANTLLTLTMEKNMTGQSRRGSIDVRSWDNISMPVVQVSWLNISQPSSETDNFNDLTKKASFEMSLEALAQDTAVVFTVYQDEATLTCQSDWVEVETENFAAGKHRAKISVYANPTKDGRSTNLVLTSGGISTDIAITQKGSK